MSGTSDGAGIHDPNLVTPGITMIPARLLHSVSGQSDGGAATGGYGATLPPYNKDSLGKPGFVEQPYWSKKFILIHKCVHSPVRSDLWWGDWLNHRSSAMLM